MDNIDIKILSHLQENGNMTNSELASHISLSSSATSDRVKKLEKNGYITGYTAFVSPKKLELEFEFLTKIKLKSRAKPNIDTFVRVVKNNNYISTCSQIISYDWNLIIGGTVKSADTYIDKVIYPLEETGLIEKLETSVVTEILKRSGLYVKDMAK